MGYCYFCSQQNLIGFANTNVLQMPFSVGVDAKETEITFFQMCSFKVDLLNKEGFS